MSEQVGTDIREPIHPDAVVIDVRPEPDEEQPVLNAQCGDIVRPPEFRLD
jgi:hypothetical protein